MLCSMCQHGTTKFWICDKCKEINCLHILRKDCRGCAARNEADEISNEDLEAAAEFFDNLGETR